MSDAIDRQAAIDALNDEFTITGKTNVIVVQDYIRRVNNRLHDLPSSQSDNDMIHLQKEQAYMQGWEDGREALRREIWEDGRDRLD